MAEDTDAEAVEPCRLLSLPGELRNRIYRYALIKPRQPSGNSRIIITASGYDRSGLLSTCKEIRAECLKIHYYENSFEVHITSFDSAPLVAWKTQYELMGLRARTNVGTTVWLRRGDPWWANLLLWLQRLHEGKVLIGLRQAQGLPSDSKIHEAAQPLVRALFGAVYEFRDQPWSRVEKHVQTFRPALTAIQRGWAKD